MLNVNFAKRKEMSEKRLIDLFTFYYTFSVIVGITPLKILEWIDVL